MNNRKLINIVKGDIQNAINNGDYTRNTERNSNIEFDTKNKQILLDGVPYSNPLMVETTYNELYTLKNNEELVPGTFYRLTDVTSAAEPNSEYDGKEFDVIVIALSKNELSEDAYILNRNDNSLNINLSKSKVGYCIENDKSRFPWADDTIDDLPSIPYITYNSEILYRNSRVDTLYNNTLYYAWGDFMLVLYTTSEVPQVNDVLYKRQRDPFSEYIAYTIVNSGNTVETYVPSTPPTNLLNGRGAIYNISEGLTNITWKDLKDLRDNNHLIPGQLYRIIDYKCATTSGGTTSANHLFDIILTALSTNTLSEEGSAIMHDNSYYVTFENGVTKKCYIYCTSVEDNFWNIVEINTMLGWDEVQDIEINEENKTAIVPLAYGDGGYAENLPYNYFQNSNLSSWKVWYCLDNDKTRFAWADDSVDNTTFESIVVENTTYTRSPNDDDLSLSEYLARYAWRNGSTIGYTIDEHPDLNEVLFDGPGSKLHIGTITSYTPAHGGTGLPNGHGVIYRLIDEWGNDIPYDFKNIMINVPINVEGYFDVNSRDLVPIYTFDYFSDNVHKDASLMVEDGTPRVCNVTWKIDYSNKQGKGGVDLPINIFYSNNNEYFNATNVTLDGHHNTFLDSASYINALMALNCTFIGCNMITLMYDNVELTFDRAYDINYGNKGVELATKSTQSNEQINS